MTTGGARLPGTAVSRAWGPRKVSRLLATVGPTTDTALRERPEERQCQRAHAGAEADLSPEAVARPSVGAALVPLS